MAAETPTAWGVSVQLEEQHPQNQKNHPEECMMLDKPAQVCLIFSAGEIQKSGCGN